MPWKCHLDAIYRVFWYLKKADLSRIVFDLSRMDVDERLFNVSSIDEWKGFYMDTKEPIPSNEPRSRDLSVKMTCYVDADHTCNRVTKRSHSKILIYIQNTPIIWYSKRQNTVEASSFGSELIALRIAIEMIESLRYKLRIFGVPIDGLTDIFCNKKSVVIKSTIPTSMLNKSHNSICYHPSREFQATRTTRIGWIDGEYSQSNILTKTSTITEKRYGISREVFGWERKDIVRFK